MRVDAKGTIPEWLKPWQNKDGSFSLHDNDRFYDSGPWHDQLLRIKYSPFNFELNQGSIGLGRIEADAITGGWETEHFDFSIFDFFHAEASAEINRGEASYGAMASIWSPSIGFSVGKFNVQLSLEIGSVGASVNKSLDSFSAKFSWFYGAGIDFSW